MLKALAVRNHAHLIKLLATYKFQDRYHMLFPYAQSNLRQFWAENIPNKDHATNLWSLRQMYGIASGLGVIHNFQKIPSTATGNGKVIKDSCHLSVKDGEEKYGRHGDLKPENILWFRELGDEPGGVLQIADFGLGRFHSRSSRSKVDPATVCTTPAYEAPEISLGQHISPAYDIWSLGCVFLEFVCWLIEGPTSVCTFQAGLEENVGSETYGARFFDLEPDPETGGKRAVVSAFIRTWIHDLREAHTSPLIRRLLDLVQDDMLVIDAERRCLCDDLAKKLESMISMAQKIEVDILGLTETPNLKQSTSADHSSHGSDRCEACISPNYPYDPYDTITSTKHYKASSYCTANAVKNPKGTVNLEPNSTTLRTNINPRKDVERSYVAINRDNSHIYRPPNSMVELKDPDTTGAPVELDAQSLEDNVENRAEPSEEESIIRDFMRGPDESDVCLPQADKVEAFCFGANLELLRAEKLEGNVEEPFVALLDERSFAAGEGKGPSRTYRGSLTARDLYRELKKPVS